MIEGFAREMPEDEMVDVLAEAHRLVKDVCELHEQLIERAGKPQMEAPAAEPDELAATVKARLASALGISVGVMVHAPGTLPRSEGGKLSRTTDERHL